MNKDIWDRTKESGSELKDVTGRRLVGVEGNPLNLYGSAHIRVQLATEKFSVEVIVAETPTADLILGRDFLRSQKCTIEMGQAEDVLHVRGRNLKVPICKGQPTLVSPILRVTLQEMTKVPPFSEKEVIGNVPAAATDKMWVVQGSPKERSAVMIARALVQPEACSIPLRLLNPRDVEVTIHKGTTIAELEGVGAEIGGVPLGDMGVAMVSEHEATEPTAVHRQTLWEIVDRSEQCLSPEEKEQLFALEPKILVRLGESNIQSTLAQLNQFVNRCVGSPSFGDRKRRSYWTTCWTRVSFNHQIARGHHQLCWSQKRMGHSDSVWTTER